MRQRMNPGLFVSMLIIVSAFVLGADILKTSNFIDKGDYYILNTGEKNAFLRLKDTYLILHDVHKVSLSHLKEVIGMQFGKQLDIIEDHPLHKHVMIRINDAKKSVEILSALRNADPSIFFISPVLTSDKRRGLLAVNPEIIIKITRGTDPDVAISRLKDVDLVPKEKLWYTNDQYAMKIVRPVSEVSEIFDLTRAVAKLDEIEWAEPNFLVAAQKAAFPADPPNDTYYDDQWHLNNTGQGGGVVDADIEAEAGWNYGLGSTGYVRGGTQQIVIAVFDDGVQTNHPDLDCDTVYDWDFNDDDNDPSPGSGDNHGTACAGCAAAVGNNSLGVVGSCPFGKILAVRLNSGFYTTWANAMRHCGVHADVVSCSWSMGSQISALNTAISEVVSGEAGHGYRREGKGSPVLFATGNNASGWRKFTLSGFSAGSYDFQWKFIKDRSVSSGYDTVWLDDIVFPGGTITENFDSYSSWPAGGWTTGGNADWTLVAAGSNQHTMRETGKSVRAGAIGNRKSTWVARNDLTVGAGNLTFWAWVSCEQGYDYMEVNINGSGNYFQYSPGQYGHQNELEYPASLADTIAVGATNNGAYTGYEERADFSQWGSALDVMAPGVDIYTTDRTGSSGYVSGDYMEDFGGTSAATPVAAGVVACLLSYNYELTAADVRGIIRSTCDEIGPYAYAKAGTNRNDYYGYGRLNLYEAMDQTPLLVVLTSFRAWNSGDAVILQWETATEIDNAGFHVWRAETPDGDYIRVTHYLIPAEGGATWGSIYFYEDDDVLDGRTYYYKLEDIDYSGVSTFHGPVFVSAGGHDYSPVLQRNRSLISH